MERINKKMMPIRNEKALDDLAIMDQLFSILNLEKQVKKALASCGSTVDASVCAMVHDLNSRVARFDRMLDHADVNSVAMAS